MESAKLKNIILVILAVTNLLLLSLMLYQQMQGRQYRYRALSDAVELLAAQGISARVEELPDRAFPSPQLLEQDESADLRAFSALLGQDAVFTRRGLVSLYTSPLGTAEVRGDGAFSVTLAEGAYSPGGQDLARFSLDILSRMGFAGQVTQVGGDSVSVVEMLGDTPVFSCTVLLRYENGHLRSISGTRLCGTPSPDPQQGTPLSTATLLVRFRAGIIESGDACTAILSATQGYILNTDATGQLQLIPVLRLETDTRSYILNAVTGELHRD